MFFVRVVFTYANGAHEIRSIEDEARTVAGRERAAALGRSFGERCHRAMLRFGAIKWHRQYTGG